MPEPLVPRVDPITLEIIRGSLASAIRDMELLMERCAMSPFIKEKKDYFVGIFDTRGRIVACHISGSGPGMLQAIMKVYPLETMRPGDVYWFNDPYISDGAVQHHQDMVFTAPIFHDGSLVAFAFAYELLARAHREAADAGLVGDDDAQLVAATGHAVTVVEGEQANIKLTTPEDLEVVEALIKEHEAATT